MKTGERGRTHPGERDGKRSGEHGDENLDALLSAQLVRDALSSSSSVADFSSSRAPLSDKEFGARKSRRDDLIEGYRRVKCSRISSGSHSPRDPKMEAISSSSSAPRATTADKLRREICEIKARMRAQWTVMDKELKRLDPHAPEPVPDDLLDPDSSDPDDVADTNPPPGDPPSQLSHVPREPPADDGAGLSTSGTTTSVLRGGFRDDFVGTLFRDSDLGWCIVTAWGGCSGMSPDPILRAACSRSPCPCPLSETFFSSEADILSWLRLSVPASGRAVGHETALMMAGNLSATQYSAAVHPEPASTSRACPPVSGRNRPLRPVILSSRQLRRVMAARETLFKFGTFVPRNDREANSSPEAPRWRAGRDLEWLRLNETGTFEGDWTLARMSLAFPSYMKRDIGHLFYVYDFKFFGEHRVRLVFDGSRQSPSTYSETYAPTAPKESVRLFECGLSKWRAHFVGLP